MFNRNQNFIRPFTLGLLVLFLAGTSACANATDDRGPNDETAADASDVRTIELEVFETPTLADETTACGQLAAGRSLDPNAVVRARAEAVREAMSLVGRECGELGAILHSTELDELSYYETVDQGCRAEDGSSTTARAPVELYVGTLSVAYECPGVRPTTGGQPANGEPGVEPIDPWGGDPELQVVPATAEPELESIVLECTDKGDPTCCQNQGCCMENGGGEGYCTARFPLGDPNSPEPRF